MQQEGECKMATTDNAQKYMQQLQQSGMKDAMPNYNADKLIQNNQSAMNGYQQAMTNNFNKYAQAGNQSLASIRQQTMLQIQNLQNQLNANKEKYKLYGQEQSALINKQYKEQNDAIDQQTFNQYKYNNQMGAQRGVSASAQQTAMDNHVGQLSAGLFNQNSQNRNDSLNTLRNKIAMGMVELDSQYSSDLTNLQISAMKQANDMRMNMAGKELEFATSMADKLMAQQMRNNELQFETERDKEMYRAQLTQKLYEMQFNGYNQMDNRNHQSNEAQKDRDVRASESALDRAFRAEQAALDRALSQSLSASRGGGGGSGKTSPSEEELLINETMVWLMENNEKLSPVEALERAKRMVRNGEQPSVIALTPPNPLIQFHAQNIEQNEPAPKKKDNIFENFFNQRNLSSKGDALNQAMGRRSGRIKQKVGI